jgi:hypothetical protein
MMRFPSAIPIQLDTLEDDMKLYIQDTEKIPDTHNDDIE